jgi:hypothetical protein
VRRFLRGRRDKNPDVDPYEDISNADIAAFFRELQNPDPVPEATLSSMSDEDKAAAAGAALEQNLEILIRAGITSRQLRHSLRDMQALRTTDDEDAAIPALGDVMADLIAESERLLAQYGIPFTPASSWLR